MKIVVDSNIVFSAILNSKSQIGHILINGSKYFDFFSPGLLKNEIIKHKSKILELTAYSQTEFADIYQTILNRIVFVDEILLSDSEIEKQLI